MNMKNDLGFIFLELQMTQNHNYIMKEIGEIIKYNPYKQVCIFNNYSERFDNYNVPVLPLSHAKFFDGDLFVIDTVSLMLTKDFPNIKRKFFYVNGPIWQEGYNSYELWKSLLVQNNLYHIVTDQKTADLFKICWGKDAYLMNQFNAEGILNAIQ